MARISDEAREFYSDSRDKKITARSASSTRTHCGKGGSVKFPSDYLSKKELKAMSGECIKYASLKAPMSWGEFKILPNDLKKEYLVFIRERFGAPDKHIADMLGTSGNTLSLYLKDIGLSAGKDGYGKKTWDKEGFLAWRGGARDDIVQSSETPVEEYDISLTEEQVKQDVNDSSCLSDKETPCCGPKLLIPKEGEMTFEGNVEDILMTISSILKGANVKLEVEWRVIADQED